MSIKKKKATTTKKAKQRKTTPAMSQRCLPCCTQLPVALLPSLPCSPKAWRLTGTGLTFQMMLASNSLH